MWHQLSVWRILNISIPVVAAILVLVSAGIIAAATTFTNGGFESFQSYQNKYWRDYPEKYGADWSVQVIEEDGLHFMDSATFAQFITNVYGVPSNNYKLEGNYSQVFASRHGFNFVFYQTVNLTPGTDYTFGGKIVSFWKGPGGERDETKIVKRIGVDWSGGTDYSDPDIEWSSWDSTDNTWLAPALANTATSSQATVFIQVDNRGDDVGSTYLNSGHIDSFYFEPAPVVNISAPSQSAPGPINVSWSTTINSPGLWALWGYDVLIKDSINNNWQTIQSHNLSGGDSENYQFSGEAGKSYTIRVRPWQQYGTGDPTRPALPGIWQEKTIEVGGAMAGQVTNHMGLPQPDVTITISGTSTTTTSLDNGHYILPTGAGTFEVLALNKGDNTAPPATSVTVPGVTSNGYLDITMRPTGAAQAITNGDFETDLSGWSLNGNVAVNGTQSHSGRGSLTITGAGNISQTNPITDVFNPLLSFWYKSDSSFVAQLLGQTTGSSQLGSQSVTVLKQSTLPAASGWSFATVDIGTTDAITGDIGVQFSFSGTDATILIDEVSIAAGPRRVYLPVIFR
jgi:hypothetical protein